MAIGVCLATTDTQAHLVESIRNRHFLESGFCKSWNVYRLLQVIQVKLDQLATLEHVETFLRIKPVDPVAPQIREGREYFLAEIKYYLSQRCSCCGMAFEWRSRCKPKLLSLQI